jgi:integrase
MEETRIHLTDKDIVRLPFAEKGQRVVRDTELKGFFVVIGRKTKTFTVQGDLRTADARRTIRVTVGEAADMTTRDARALAKGYLSEIARGVHPKPEAATRRTPKAVEIEARSAVARPGAITLNQAWERYRDAHMVRKGRSEKTISDYGDHVGRIFAEWKATALKHLAEDPAKVAAKHDEITRTHGPYMANVAMRTLRAIYNHAMKSNPSLPGRNPVNAVDWNKEERRNTAMGLAELPHWFEQLAAFENPIRREFHLFTLLSGCRPGALRSVRPEHLDLRRRALHIPRPKGGSKKAFDIPLSREMIRCLVRAIRFSRLMHPDAAASWVFAAGSRAGHIMEQKEERETLSKWGNDLRQSFRTIAQAAGVSEFDARLLMNHAIPGVNAGYITRGKLLDDHLRHQQQVISKVLMDPAMKALARPGAIRDWLGPGAGRRLKADAGIDERQSARHPPAGEMRGSARPQAARRESSHVR